MSPSCSAAFRPLRTPLTLAIGLILSAHAFAGDASEEDAKRDPTKNVDTVIVVGQRYLRGQVPHQLVPEVDRLLKAWRGTGHMGDPRRQAIRVLDFLLASDGFGAMR